MTNPLHFLPERKPKPKPAAKPKILALNEETREVFHEIEKIIHNGGHDVSRVGITEAAFRFYLSALRTEK